MHARLSTHYVFEKVLKNESLSVYSALNAKYKGKHTHTKKKKNTRAKQRHINYQLYQSKKKKKSLSLIYEADNDSSVNNCRNPPHFRQSHVHEANNNNNNKQKKTVGTSHTHTKTGAQRLITIRKSFTSSNIVLRLYKKEVDS